MPVDRFFAEETFNEGETLSLTGDEFHHLSRAVRKRTGEAIELINGGGELAKGTVLEIQKNACLIAIEEVSHQERKTPRIILIQAIPRMNRLDTIIEKATELGAAAIHLFPGDYSERKEITLERLNKITRSAIKQSGHLYLPEVAFFKTLEESLEGDLYYGDTDAKAPLLFSCLKDAPSIAIVIGPESGLSLREEALLKEKGAKGVKLAEAILRTDTAPIVALGLIAHFTLKE
jgi:16S rRNA (uracil1498-N3)-methyltransferase